MEAPPDDVLRLFRPEVSDPSLEDSNADRRRDILRIQADQSLDNDVKARRIQDLMMSKYRATQQVAQRLLPSETVQHALTHMRPGILGCSHYQRGCKLRAACCGRFYTCRLCHDAGEDHTIDRYATREMLCMHCDTIQPVAQMCVNPACQKKLAAYYCDVCKFWDDDDTKDIYHCPHCNLCRIGKGLDIDFFHCMKCNACMTISRKEKHRCIERALESACPICHGGSLFTSTDPVVFVACGHSMHESCFKQYIRQSFTCPICCKALYDAKHLYGRIDAEVAQHQLPAEFRGKQSDVFCNDCELRSTVPFHFMYHKCAHCGGYNTRVV
eukprot:TRINITY_DN15133_c0_g1_i1.p1 TRINITY_DN15133_c0_g1~~TRINITY_DN15133_c0_g1_i1.p1  ORF type:complete len:327 (+),score=36.40 TRINITY_DN15133_c0_g1_i1:113-1093(+)